MIKKEFIRRTTPWVLMLGLTFAQMSAEGYAQDWPTKAQDIALYKGKDRQKMLEEGAKRETEITTYTTTGSAEVRQFIKESFEKKYHVRVNQWRSGNVEEKILTEYRAGQVLVDVIEAIPVEKLVTLVEKAPIFMPFYSPAQERYDPMYRSKDGKWQAVYSTVLTFGYNPRAIKKGDLPAKLEDLLDAKYKGMSIGVDRSDEDWLFAVATEHFKSEERGIQWFERLVSTHDVKAHRGHSAVGQLVIAGELAMSPALYQHFILTQKHKGAPIEWHPLKGGSVLKPFAMAISSQIKSPHAAMLFIDHLLTPEVQAVYKQDNRLAVEGRPDFSVIFGDWRRYIKEDNKWRNHWRRILKIGR